MAKPPDKKSFEAQLADITQQIENKQREMVGHSSSRHICPQHSMTSRVCVILESVVTAHRWGNQRQDAAVAARAGRSQHEAEVDRREDPPKQRRNLEEGESCDFELRDFSHFQNPYTRAAQEYRQWCCCERCVLGLTPSEEILCRECRAKNSCFLRSQPHMVLRLCWCVVDARRSAGRPRRIYEVECFLLFTNVIRI